jgi:putative membrane protein
VEGRTIAEAIAAVLIEGFNRVQLTVARRAGDTSRVRDGYGSETLAALLIGWGVNVVALLVVDSIFDGVEIGRWGSVLIGAAVLGIANAIVKPVLALLTLPLILLTLGLAYFAINVLMLAIAEWVAPNFSIDGFWTYIGATIVVWLVNWILNSALGSLFGGRDMRRVAV